MSCFGSKYKLANDHLGQMREELARYKKSLEVIRRTVETLELNLAHLKPAHDELLRNLDRMFPHDGALGDRVIHQATILTNHVKWAFDESKPDYLAMKQKLDKLQAEIAHCEQQLAERDKAYSPKVHYEKKMERLRARSSMAGTEKIDRNLRKQSAAANKWQELDENTTKELERLLEHRFESVAEVVDMHARRLITYYDICLEQLPSLPKIDVFMASLGEVSKSAPRTPPPEKSNGDVIAPSSDALREPSKTSTPIERYPTPQKVSKESDRSTNAQSIVV